MFSSGDGRVSKSSLTNGIEGVSDYQFGCVKHDALLSDKDFQIRLMDRLILSKKN